MKPVEMTVIRDGAAGGENPLDQLEKVRAAIRDYHYALDTRQHGGVAQDRAFNAICVALNMSWRQGEEAAARKAARDPYENANNGSYGPEYEGQ